MLNAIVVGGDPFDAKNELLDKRIGAISVISDDFVMYNCESIFK